MKKLLLIIFVTLCINCPGQVYPQQKRVEISEFLFGQNLWLTSGAEGRPGYIIPGLMPKVQSSGVKMIRIGGNGYDSKMPGIDTLVSWVKAIKSIGAEPMLQCF